MIDLDRLNESQREAVDWGEGAALVLAGPGSGKTHVLTVRIARLIDESPDDRYSILGITFTNKAAAEMRERIELLVPQARERVRIVTFHAFAADLLSLHGSHLGLAPDFTLLTLPEDRLAVLESVLRDLAAAGQPFATTDVKLLPLLDRVFAQCIQEEKVADLFADRDLGARVQTLFGAYLGRLVRDARLDFQALIYLAVRLLETRAPIARQLRVVFPYVCVDEFQDTNLAQYRLLKGIVGAPPANLFVVADDDQIIYQWNGANPERLRELQGDYRMTVIQLPQNYRCPPEVIALANELIRHQNDRMPGKLPLIALRDSAGNPIRTKSFPDVDAELAWIAADIGSRPRAEQGECVLLGRTLKLLQQAVDSLQKAGLPAFLAVRKDEFTTPPMQWVHAMLRLANGPGDREALQRVCRTFHRIEGIRLDPQDVTAEAAAGDGDVLRAWLDGALRRQELDPRTRTFLGIVQAGLGERRDHAGFVSAAADWIRSLKDCREALGPEAIEEFEDEWAVFTALVDDVVRERDGDVSLHALLQSLDLASKSPAPPAGAVRCMTVHAAKGLEFRHVYLFGLAEEVFPSYHATKAAAADPSAIEMQEERRNCFVAITRTRETLTLTWAARYGYPKQPSRFLYEMKLLLPGGAWRTK